jgi:hypothetical protein
MVVLHIYLSLLRPRRLWQLRLWLCNEFRTVVTDFFDCRASGFPHRGHCILQADCTTLLWVSLVPARRAPRIDGARDLWQRKGELWTRNGRVNLAYSCDFHGNSKDFLHPAKLRHGTDGFASPPKEVALRIFSHEKSDGFSRV